MFLTHVFKFEKFFCCKVLFAVCFSLQIGSMHFLLPRAFSLDMLAAFLVDLLLDSQYLMFHPVYLFVPSAIADRW
jgi:hypothetical protein